MKSLFVSVCSVVYADAVKYGVTARNGIFAAAKIIAAVKEMIFLKLIFYSLHLINIL